MGQATRTTKLEIDLGPREQGGTNQVKRQFLEETVAVLNRARAFYLDFFLAHADKLSEHVSYFSQKHQEERTRTISADELLTWAEFQTVTTKDHPHPLSGWNFSQAFPEMPCIYRRSVIKDAIGKASKSHRLNRKLANQIRGLIRDDAKDQAFRHGTVTVEVNPHGTSQYCSRCGAKGERFSYRSGQRVKQRGGKLFACPTCHYEANADFNASVNVHHSFYREYHWQPKPPVKGRHTP